MGIFRTNKSGKWSTNLLPNLKETTYDIQTADGQYYWGTEYTKKTITITFAFYGLNE
jgi:hypothetical protein